MKRAGGIGRLWVFFIFLLAAGQGKAEELIIFHAGSLTVPFARIIEDFRKENPGITVLREIAGSRECARKISELKKPCDVFASADYQVIDTLLIPQNADWNLKFATNEMTIVYRRQSRYAPDFNTGNWFKILARSDVAVGRSDPDMDPCGYRTILTLRLAEIFLRTPGLADSILKKTNRLIRPKEVDLLALLETGAVDYLFLYRSVAEQHGLKFLTLPDEINLSNADLESYYQQVSVELSGTEPGRRISQKGSSMVYGVTIPRNAPNRLLANKFIHYLMHPDKGLRIMRQMGQPTVVPSRTNTYNRLPAEFKTYARPMDR